MFETVFAAIVVALTAVGLIQLIRLIPWVYRQMLAGKKPWVCDLCMSFWTSILSGSAWALLGAGPWRAIIPSFALTMLVTRVLGAPTSEYNVDDIPELKEPEITSEK
jgi:hypothetical protein